MHFCVDSSKRRIPGSLNGEGNHLEEKKLLGYIIPIVSEKCVELPGFKYTWWYLILADQEILECFRASGWDQIITVLKGRIRLQALNSVMLVFILLVSRVVQVLFCTAAVSADVYSISSYGLQRDSGFCQINCCYLLTENSEAGHEALSFKVYGQEFSYVLMGLYSRRKSFPWQVCRMLSFILILKYSMQFSSLGLIKNEINISSSGVIKGMSSIIYL